MKHWAFYTTELQSFGRNTDQCLIWAFTPSFCQCSYLSELWALFQIVPDKSSALLQWAYKGLTRLQDEGRATGIIYMNLYTAFDTLSHTTPLPSNWRDTDLTGGCRTAVLQHPHSLLQSCEAAAISHILPPQYRFFLSNSRSEAVFTFAYLFLHTF